MKLFRFEHGEILERPSFDNSVHFNLDQIVSLYESEGDLVFTTATDSFKVSRVAYARLLKAMHHSD